MTQIEILNKLILGTDPYISYGVPTPIWNLIIDLTKEIYGDAGVKILESAHQKYVDPPSEELHSLQKWEQNGTKEILPKELIKRLEKPSK